MKKLYTLLALIATTVIFAQAPQGFNYQATVRNSSGALIVNQNVNFKFNIMLNSQTSVPIFSETHFAPTDDLGQVNLVIGTGTATTGSFSTINWGTGNYYLGIELNTGSGYVAMGTTQLLSVPYALYANSAGNAQAPTPDLATVLAVNNGANNLQIKNLADPTEAQDAVTKSFSEAQLQAQVAQLQVQIESLQDQITLIQNPIINVIPSPTQASICSGTNTAITLSNSNNSPNITYSWTVSCISGSISGYYDQPQSPISMINQVLTNTGTSSGLVRYVVTPYLGANSGQSVNVDVTVNVGPNNIWLNLVIQGCCQNQIATPLSVGNPNSAGNYQWCVGYGVLSAIPIPGETNSTFTPPTNVVGVKTYSCLLTDPLNQCNYFYTDPIEFTVSQMPSIANINVNINSGDTINLTPTNGGGINNSDIVPPNTIYSWANNNASIGLNANGSSTDLIFTPTNSGTTPMVAQIIVIPSTGSCQGESFTITLTINPSLVAQLPNVTIGNQIWSSTNLDVSTYRDGTPIPEVIDPTQWVNLTTGAWCYYNNDSANGTVYGKLYNWYAVAGIHDTDPNTPNKILAPLGWHVPSDSEWTALTDFLGGLSVTGAGGKMKETGTSHWLSPNTAATNSSGFTGLPGGARVLNGTFYGIGSETPWWSLTEYNTTNAWYRVLNSQNGGAASYFLNKIVGCSVRCLRD
jgi:uncharacterized protein (TIGR02145 family)